MQIDDMTSKTERRVGGLRVGDTFRFNGHVYVRCGMDLNSGLGWTASAKPNCHMVFNLTKNVVDSMSAEIEVEPVSATVVIRNT